MTIILTEPVSKRDYMHEIHFNIFLYCLPSF